MNATEYLKLRQSIIDAGYSEEVEWAGSVSAPDDADQFAVEACWVILNSGMKEQVARGIWERVRPALLREGACHKELFGHAGKRAAINRIWQLRVDLFSEWRLKSPDKQLDYLETLPWIGPITKFHLARNLGMDVCKPDRHLVRIAGDETPEQLCQRLAKATGDRIGQVDCVIWRAANLGLV